MGKRIPREVSSYFAKSTSEAKKTLLEMRRMILDVIPEAEEVMKYGMPTFIYQGNAVAGIMAHKNHIGYYPYSGSVLKNFPEITAQYKTTRGALHIPFGKPLPKTTVKKLIKARIALCPVARGEVDLAYYAKLDSEWRKIGIAAPARRGLIDNKLTKLSQLKNWRESDLKNIHAIGPTALKIIKQEMKKKGITFK